MDKKETKKVAPSESSKYLSFKEEKVTTTFDEKEQAPISSEDARLEKIRKKALANQRLRVHKKMLAEEKLHKKERKSADKENFISLHNINKIYDNHVQAVYNFNLDIKKQEFIVLVGPSGCGKSTTLRMIAGLESITGGDLFIDGVYANDLEPKNRDIAMVFQSYALYPHMSVEANMGFGLKIRKIPKPIFDRSGKPVTKINKGLIADCRRERNDLVSLYNEIRTSNPEKAKEVEKDIDEMTQKINYLSTTHVQVYKQCHIDKKEIKSRVMNAAKILQIEEYLDRKPKALSGGQCQRVALGRAIVRNAKVFLMDEPLSNLDAKLRVQMRSEIIKLHNQLNATTVYVTHDQTEAMTMASRIVVMSKGYVQQIGTPLEIYNHPANIFVATFIGSPSMNLFNGPFEKGTFLFSNGAKLALPAEFATAVETFYKNELVNNQKEIDSITNDFVELQELLRKRSELSSRGASVHEVDEEIKAVESSNERLSFLKKNIAQYQEFLSKKKYDVIFGIRPEDIFEKHQTPTSSSLSPIIKTNIAVSEILGNEYFVHINFAGKDLVAKIASKTLISSGENIEIVFDLDRAHLFDQASGKLII